jgi:hypothetical protein
MGVRIDAHAVDVVALRRVVERPLWRIFLDILAEHREDDRADVLVSVFNPQTHERYRLGRRGIISLRVGRETRRVDEDQLRRDPFLQQPMSQHLGDPLPLMFLLRALTRDAQGRRYVVPITSGHRRWWMQSAIKVARNGVLGAKDAEQLAEYLGRILRSYSVDIELPRHPQRPPTYDVPGLPRDAEDYFVAVFDEPQCRHLGALAARVAEYEGEFPMPKIWADNPATVAA